MYKLTITEGEKTRILKLHGGKLIEQAQPQGKVEQGKPLVIPLGNTFPSGQYKIQNTGELDNAVQQIQQYTQKYPENVKINVTIEASESHVPNRGVNMQPGELSKNRLQQVQQYLNGKLPKNATVTPVDKGAQGPEWKQGMRSDDPQFTQYQYVKITASVEGQITRRPEFCDRNKDIKADGGYNLPENGYLRVEPHDIGAGAGKLTLTLDALNVPDIFYIEYNGKTYGDTMFHGWNTSYFKLAIGTALNIAFPGGSGKPAQLGNNTWAAESDLNKVATDLLASRQAQWTWIGKLGHFTNIFEASSKFANPQLVQLFQQIDGSKNVNQILKLIKGRTDIPWAYLTSNIGKPYYSIEIDKLENVNEIKVVNIAPCGSTGWRITGRCQ